MQRVLFVHFLHQIVFSSNYNSPGEKKRGESGEEFDETKQHEDDGLCARQVHPEKDLGEKFLRFLENFQIFRNF